LMVATKLNKTSQYGSSEPAKFSSAWAF